MLFLTTTERNMWFLRGVRQQGKRSDYDPSALPATRKRGTVATAAELRHRELAAGILIKGVGSSQGEEGRFCSDFYCEDGGGTKSEVGSKETTEG